MRPAGDLPGVARVRNTSPFACRNCRATSAGDCLSIATAAFICCIALVVSTLLTALSVSSNAGPSALSTLVDTIGVTFWKPKTFFGSSSTTYLPLCSWPSVVKTSAVSILPSSSAWY